MNTFSLFSDPRAGGYRLKRLEFFNWGTFNNHIWEIHPECESSLLTGANGSGKTTLVDAITTLLVPPVVRHYNQSSGAEKKRERTEESYLLGAFGNIREEENAHVKVQYLRDKDSHSLILGVFYNAALNRTVSLGQIRYFTKTGMTRVYFVSQRELGLNSHVLPLDNRGEYKRRLEKDKTQFFDTFSGYATTFIKYLGFRSVKALNLFSQTVGVKVLGDINEFIRNHMLEQGKVMDSFDEIYQNFLQLLNTQNHIERAEKEVELLSVVKERGDNYVQTQKKVEEGEEKLSFFPHFQSRYLKEEFSREIEVLKDKLGYLTDKMSHNEEALKSNSRSLREYQRTLDSNQSAEQLRSLEKDIDFKEEAIQRSKKLWNQYDYFIKKEFDKRGPETRDIWETQTEMLKKQKEVLTEKENSLQEEYYQKRILLDQTEKDITEKEREFLSLKDRDSNIPMKNVEIRDRIARELNLPKEALPFAGECITVEDKKWEKAIERVLHSFALCILVEEENYAKVNDYVNGHNLKGRLVYFRVNNLSPGILQEKSHPDSLIEKIGIKSNSPFKHWIKNRILQSYNYICTDSLEDFKRMDMGLTSEGLVKKGNRHEKDDRRREETGILGWNNLEKRAWLEKQIRELKKSLQKEKEGLKAVDQDKKQINDSLRTIDTLLDFNFEDMNWFLLEKELQKLLDERKTVLENSKDLKRLEKEIFRLQKEEGELKEEQFSLSKHIGQVEGNLHQREEGLQKEEAFLKENPVPEEKEVILSDLKVLFLKRKNPGKEELPLFKDSLHEMINRDREKRERDHTRVISAMNDFTNPKKEILAKYPSWSEDTRDLKPHIDYLRDFFELHKRVLNNDLPRYKEQFKDFLNQRIMEDMASFQQTLNDELNDIKKSIKELNSSLKQITYQEHPPTYITLNSENSKDVAIKEFQRELKNTFADAFKVAQGDFGEMELFFNKSRKMLTRLKEDDNRRKKVLDVRNWLHFSAEERYKEDDSLKQVYQDSQSLSGGEKAKLAYTVLASAIAYQFGIQGSNSDNSFRFVVVDEAFSKVDPVNSRFAMNLFNKLNLQLMVVTPLDRINLVEDYINSVHFVEKKSNNETSVYNMVYTEYQMKKKEFQDDKLQ